MFGVVSQSLGKRLMLIVSQAPTIASSVIPPVANLIERNVSRVGSSTSSSGLGSALVRT
jgi:hypothetical protein